MPTNNPDLATLLAAVEQAWEDQRIYHGVCGCRVAGQVSVWLAALRAVRDSGYAVALVSREAVEALREEQRLSERCAEGDGTNDDLYEARDCASHRACDLLARDLAGLLKETP